MLTSRRWLLVCTALAALVWLWPVGAANGARPARAASVRPAGTPAVVSTAEQQFVARIGALRAAHRLAPVRVDAALTVVGRVWSMRMAASGHLAHNPDLGAAVSGWQALDENVGDGPSVDDLWRAFVASPHHLENLLDPQVSAVGVGVVRDGSGRLWTTQDFELPQPEGI